MPLQLHTHVISYFGGEERGYRYLFTFFLSLDFFGINGWMSLGERAGHEQKSLKCQYYTHFKWSITSVQVLITLNYYHCCIYLLNRRSLQYPTLNMYANKEENFSFCLTREVCCKLANKFHLPGTLTYWITHPISVQLDRFYPRELSKWYIFLQFKR